MQHVTGSLRRQRQAVSSRFLSYSIDLELSAPAEAVTATWTTPVRTFVTYRISPGICCQVGGFSSGVDDSDDVTEESVGSSTFPGVGMNVFYICSKICLCVHNCIHVFGHVFSFEFFVFTFEFFLKKNSF